MNKIFTKLCFTERQHHSSLSIASAMFHVKTNIFLTHLSHQQKCHEIIAFLQLSSLCILKSNFKCFYLVLVFRQLHFILVYFKRPIALRRDVSCRQPWTNSFSVNMPSLFTSISSKRVMIFSGSSCDTPNPPTADKIS